MSAVLAAAAVLLAAGALLPVVLRGRRAGTRGAAARARSAHARLGHLLATSPVGGDRHRRATQRWHSAGALLAHACSAPEFALAEQVAREGVALLERRRRRRGRGRERPSRR